MHALRGLLPPMLAWFTRSRSRPLPFFFFNDTATTEIYTLSLHDALPISDLLPQLAGVVTAHHVPVLLHEQRSEEHTSELQSRPHLVCRLLLEKKKDEYAANLCSSIINEMSRTTFSFM